MESTTTAHKLWRVHLLDGPLLQDPADQTISRFRFQRVGALLAYLALRLGRPCPREELCAALWPDEEDLQITSRRLRVTLASLRRQMEPPGTPFGTVLDVSDKRRICLRAETVWCDVVAIDAALRKGNRQEAAHLLTGPLLPGYYDEWIVAEQARLELLREDLEPLRAGEAMQQVSLIPPSRTQPPTPQQEIRHSTASFPLSLTRFFGREAEEERLLSLLQHNRLVTLIGPGGIGKTRLALEMAARLSAAFEDAVWFVPLAELTDARLILKAITETIQPSHGEKTTPSEQVLEAISQQPCLLILDNCEQLVETGALVIAELLQRMPQLTCLITSRQRLNIEGEVEFALDPLPAPALPGTPERLWEFASVRLYVDRAQAVRPDFQITPHNAGAIAALCARLEGIPLAIELAAAWAQTLTPAQMLERLAHDLDLLVNRRKGHTARHRTLYAAMEWSFRLLPAELQRLFAHLSVFRGGWTLEAAECVCSTDEGVQDKAEGERGRGGEREKNKDEGGRRKEEYPTPDTQHPMPERLNTRIPEHLNVDVLEMLRQLRECSLVVAEEAGAAMRYRMLEMLREYADEQLAPEEREAVRRRHACYFVELAEALSPHIGGSDMKALIGRLDADYDNLHAALSWATTTGEVEIGLRLAVSLGRYWYINGSGIMAQQGQEWFARLLKQPEGLPPVLYGKALGWAGTLACYAGNLPLALARHEEGLAVRRAAEDKAGIADSLNGLGIIAFCQNDYQEAITRFQESLVLWQELADTRYTARLLFNLAIVYEHLEDRIRAHSFYEESLALWRSLGPCDGLLHCLDAYGRFFAQQGDISEALRLLAQALELSHELGGQRRSLLADLEQIASLLATNAQPEQSARLFGAAHYLREVWNLPASDHLADHALVLSQLRNSLGEVNFAGLFDQGSAMTTEQAITYALKITESVP